MKTSYRNLQYNKSRVTSFTEQISFGHKSKHILPSISKQGFKFKTHLSQQEPDGFPGSKTNVCVCWLLSNLYHISEDGGALSLSVFIVTSYCKYYYRHSQPCYPACHVNTHPRWTRSKAHKPSLLLQSFIPTRSQYFLVLSLLYFWSASVLWTLEQYMRCNTQSSDMGWHPLCHPTLSFLTSETRINITNGHTPHTRPSPGGKLFVCVHLFHYRDKRVLPESGQERESIYLLMLLTTSPSSEWLSNCYNSRLDPEPQSEQFCIRQTFCLMPR